MDKDSRPWKLHGHDVREAQSEALRQPSMYSIPVSTAAAAGERARCRLLRPLGVFMPLLLLPVLFLGSKYGGCLYCLLLPLLLCAFRAIPKPATALLHLVTIPILGLLEPEIIAGQYLAFEVLIVTLLLFLVVVLDAWSDLVHNMAQLLCARFGLRRGPLFAGACACSFAGAWLFSSAVASVVVVYFLDRILYTIRREKMDQPPENFQLSSQQDSAGSLRSAPLVDGSAPVVEASAPAVEDQALFDRLAQIVLAMKKPERRIVRIRRLSAQKCAPATPVKPASPQASGGVTPVEPVMEGLEYAEDKDERKDKKFRPWRLKWFKKQGTTDGQEKLQAVTTHATSSADADQPIDHQDGTVVVTTPAPLPQQRSKGTSTVPKKVLRIQEQGLEKKQDELPEQRSLDGLSVPQFGASQPIVPGSRKASGTAHSAMDASVTEQAARKKSRVFSILFWGENRKADKVRNIKETTGGTSSSTTQEGKARPSWYRKMSAFALKLVGRRFSVAPLKPAAGAEEDAGARTNRPADDTSKFPSGSALCHHSDNYRDVKNDVCVLSPPVTDGAGTFATATGVDAASSSKRADLSFGNSPFPPATKTLATLAPVVKSSGREVAVANVKGQAAAPNTTAFDSHSPNELPAMAELGNVKALLSRACTFGDRNQTPSITVDSATRVAPRQEEFTVEKRAKPAASFAADPSPMTADTCEFDSKTVSTESDRAGNNDPVGHHAGTTPDLVANKETPIGVKTDVEGQVCKDMSHRTVNGADVTPATATNDIVPTKNEDKDAERDKKVRKKTSSGKGKSAGGKKRKRSGKRSADSASSKSSGWDSVRPGGSTPVSDHPSDVSHQKSDQPSYLYNSYTGENTEQVKDPKAVSTSAIKRDEHRETTGFNVALSAKGGLQCASVSQRATPSSAGALPSAEYEVAKTRSTSAEGDQITKTSVQLEATDKPELETATALVSKRKLKRGRDDGASDTGTSKESRTSRSSSKRSGHSSDTKKVIKDPAEGLHGKNQTTTEVGSKNACPEGVATEIKDDRPASNIARVPEEAKTAGVVDNQATQVTAQAASSSTSQGSNQESAATPVEEKQVSTASEVRLTPTPRLISSQLQARFKSQEKRKQSAVSFGAEVKGPQSDKALPRESTALAHLQELAPKSATRYRSLSTILKTSTTPTRFGLQASSVDFGPEKFTLISPLHSAGGSRLSSRPSRFSVGSVSSFGESDGVDRVRRPTAPYRAMRSRSYMFDDTTTVRSGGLSARQSTIGSQFGTATKKKTKDGRVDVHNAFILGPSLMSVLGNICSFHSGGNKKALRGVSLASHATQRSISDVTWAIVTLPGVLLALVTCSAVIWLIYVRPYDPEPYSSENLAVMRVAREKRESRQRRQRGVQFACAAYVTVFVVTYVPSRLLNMDQRMALLSALTSMMLATSLVTSCMQAAFDFVRQIWQMVPWSIILFIGATQVSSKLLQVYNIPHEVFKLVSTSFWEQYTALEVQAMLAIASSLMAETADKQVLVQLMAPVVVNIAEVQRMHPTYYAIPVIVGASCNVIMPASAPLALLHELARVSFWKLLLLGLLVKAIVVGMVIVMVNVADKSGFLGGQATPE